MVIFLPVWYISWYSTIHFPGKPLVAHYPVMPYTYAHTNQAGDSRAAAHRPQANTGGTFQFKDNRPRPLSIAASPDVMQLMKVGLSDIGKTYLIEYDGAQINGKLLGGSGSGWYAFDVGGSTVKIQGERKILHEITSSTTTSSVPTFTVSGITFNQPSNYKFDPNSAWNATQSTGMDWNTITGRNRKSGVEIGDVGSYGGVQYLEKTGDKLTGDHQPSGAAIKQAIADELRKSLDRVLTRSMANTAYKKAITIVVTDAWHKSQSRTYGGRNTQAQIANDAGDLMTAAMEDWKRTVPDLLNEGYTKQEIIDIWNVLDKMRQDFFKTGQGQWWK